LVEVFHPGMSRIGHWLRLFCETRQPAAVREKEIRMKYILLMSGTKQGVDTYRTWSEKDIQSHFAELTRINDELKRRGEFVASEGLGFPQQAQRVIADEDGAPVTDGVFPESKEFVLGYWIVDVERPERAYEIAGLISGAHGPGGVRTRMPIEVRQIMSKNSPE
jgi:hypothetical protein